MPSEAETLVRECLWAGKVGEIAQGLLRLTAMERGALRKESATEAAAILKAWAVMAGWDNAKQREEAIPKLKARYGKLPHDPQDRAAHVTTLRLFLVGVGTRRETESALFGSNWRWMYHSHSELGRDSFTYRAGRILATRDEAWRPEVLKRVIDSQEDGYAINGQPELARDLVLEGILPEAELMPSLSRLARRVGFHQFQWDDLDLRILRAALEARDEPFWSSIDYDNRQIQMILEHAREGRLSRQGLLDLALRRLSEASKVQDAAWWARLVEQAELTDEEWDTHAEATLDLLAAPNPRATATGVAAVGKLLTRGTVQATEAIPLLGITVQDQVGGTAKGAVALLRKLTRDPEVRIDALRAGLGALQHPKAAVGDAVIAWLEKDRWWRDDWEAAALVADAAIMAPPAYTSRLQPLLPAEETGEAPPAEEIPEASTQLKDRLETARLATRDDRHRDHLTRCLAALDPAVPLPPPHPPLESRWRWDAPFSVPATPVETAELMLRVTVAPLTPRDWERMLAGVRLPINPEVREGLVRLLDPLVRLRARQENPKDRIRTQTGVDSVLRLIECWLAFEPGEITLQKSLQAPWCRPLMKKHLQTLRAARTRRDVPPPLALPTHNAGWIDPMVFAERLARYGEITPNELQDLASALYRLPPDADARLEAWRSIRSAKLQLTKPAELMLRVSLAPEDERKDAEADLVGWRMAEGVKSGLGSVLGAIGQKVRDVLEPGTATVPESSPLYTLRLVTAAFRCRYGMGEASQLQRLIPIVPPGWQWFVEKWSPEGSHLLVRPWPLRQVSADDRHSHLAHNWSGVEQFTQAAYLLPEWGPCAAAGAGWFQEPEANALAFPTSVPQLISARVTANLPSWQGGLAPDAVRSTLRADCPVTEVVPALLGAVGENTQIHGIAAEVLHHALTDGRLSHATLATVVGDQLARKESKPRVLLKVMEILAGSYPAFRVVAAAAGQHAVAQGLDGHTPTDRVAILEALQGWLAASGTAVENVAARERLQAFVGAGKSGRAVTLAKQLLTLEGRSQEPESNRLRAMDVEAAAFPFSAPTTG